MTALDINALSKKIFKECKTLPFTITDKVGCEITLRGYRHEDYVHLVSMYDDFEPKGIAMGIPPHGRM